MNPSLQLIKLNLFLKSKATAFIKKESRGDVPGWVLVVLMTTALVTGIWSIAAPKLTTILRNSLDAMGGIKQLRRLLLAQSRGSVESFLTILPQVFVFLVMFQLIFMQFNVMADTNLSQGELARIAINGGSGTYQRYPLIGGGSVLVADQQGAVKKFIDFGNISSRKVLTIAVDEDESN